jgi:hypothetical protein
MKIGRCERVLGDVLDWRLWVGNHLLKELPHRRCRLVSGLCGVVEVKALFLLALPTLRVSYLARI